MNDLQQIICLSFLALGMTGLVVGATSLLGYAWFVASLHLWLGFKVGHWSSGDIRLTWIGCLILVLLTFLVDVYFLALLKGSKEPKKGLCFICLGGSFLQILRTSSGGPQKRQLLRWWDVKRSYPQLAFAGFGSCEMDSAVSKSPRPKSFQRKMRPKDISFGFKASSKGLFLWKKWTETHLNSKSFFFGFKIHWKILNKSENMGWNSSKNLSFNLKISWVNSAFLTKPILKDHFFCLEDPYAAPGQTAPGAYGYGAPQAGRNKQHLQHPYQPKTFFFSWTLVKGASSWKCFFIFFLWLLEGKSYQTSKTPSYAKPPSCQLLCLSLLRTQRRCQTQHNCTQEELKLNQTNPGEPTTESAETKPNQTKFNKIGSTFALKGVLPVGRLKPHSKGAKKRHSQDYGESLMSIWTLWDGEFQSSRVALGFRLPCPMVGSWKWWRVVCLVLFGEFGDGSRRVGLFLGLVFLLVLFGKEHSWGAHCFVPSNLWNGSSVVVLISL